MATASRFAISTLVALLIATSSSPFAQTLLDVLREHRIPVGSSSGIWQKPITSFAVLDNDANFAIAYYVDDGSGLLSPPLFLGRYDRKHHTWKDVALKKIEASFKGVPVDCMGSALSIVQQAGSYFLHTHLNPSAGCLLVLSEDLALKKTLCGRYLAAFRSGLFVYQKCQVHFAPTHPMEIALYDPVRDVETQIYPPPSDTIRAEYVNSIRRLIPSNHWCHRRIGLAIQNSSTIGSRVLSS
ncbi:MAG TPA: hypothetical protein VGQ11_09855 [Candidatus Acidoferrales bacterium]|nr:hypothetical protein [Candidatus Acidoferrales bacterium]